MPAPGVWTQADRPTMRLAQLIDGLGLAMVRGDGEAGVPDIADDSRRVTPGSLFIARAGAAGRDGTAFIADALKRGATSLILPENADCVPPEYVNVVRAEAGVAVDHALASRLAERFFGNPSAKLRVVGITGTNGKTTVAYLTRHLLAAAGCKCGLIGTIETDDGSGRPRPAELTTPGPIDTARLLAAMVSHGCAAAAMEVSSHALHQGRTAGLRFHAAVFTNLTGDHLDYHGSMDAYADAKARLFAQVPAEGYAIINADDPYAVTMLGAGAARVQWTTLDPKLVAEAEARGDEQTALGFAYAKTEALAAHGSRVVLTGTWGSLELDLPLIGRHNVANALQAAAAASCVTDVSRTLRSALRKCPQVPGRLERISDFGLRISDLPKPQIRDTRSAAAQTGVPGSTSPPSCVPQSEIQNPKSQIPNVLVDYAHTHDALENVLTALRPLTPGRLIAVVGCGGDRDATKRPKMARVAADLTDVAWITSDNPRTEDPDAIINDMLNGIGDLRSQTCDLRDQNASRVADRRSKINIHADRARAIALAIHDAQTDDTVLIAGKGHEDYQIIADASSPTGTRKIHFDDREHAAEALRARSTRVAPHEHAGP